MRACRKQRVANSVCPAADSPRLGPLPCRRCCWVQVLPPLLQELRDTQLQPTLLPIVLKIVQQQEPGEFADATLPALRCAPGSMPARHWLQRCSLRVCPVSAASPISAT